MSNKSKAKEVKQVHKSKEQLEAEEKAKARARVLRGKVREEIYPLACEIEGIEFVKHFFTSFLGLVRQAGLELVDTLSVESLRIKGKSLDEYFPREDKNYDKYLKLWEMVKHENVRDTNAMLFGFDSHINSSLQRENITRKLDTLADFTKAFAEEEPKEAKESK